MKKLNSVFAFAIIATLVAGPALAQTAAPAKPAVPAAVTAPAATTPAATSKAARSAKSVDCSKQADAKNLHGKARKTFRNTCMKG